MNGRHNGRRAGRTEEKLLSARQRINIISEVIFFICPKHKFDIGHFSAATGSKETFYRLGS